MQPNKPLTYEIKTVADHTTITLRNDFGQSLQLSVPKEELMTVYHELDDLAREITALDEALDE